MTAVRRLRLAAARALLALLPLAAFPAFAQPEPASCTGVAEIGSVVREVWQGGRLVDRAEVPVPDTLPRAWRSPAYELRYRIPVGACRADRAPRALLLFRVGGPYEITGHGAALQPLRQHAQPPYNGRIGGLFFLDNAVAEAEVRLTTLPNVSAGMIRIAAGPQAQVLAGPAELHHRWQQLTLILSALLAMAGIVGLAVASRRRLDPRISWFALACAVWAARGQWLQLPGIPIDAYVYEQTNAWLIASSSLLVTASTLALTGAMTRRRAWGWVTAAAVVFAGLLATFAMPSLASPYRLACFGGAFALLLGMVTLLAMRARRLGRSTAGWLAAGYLSVMVGGTHDLLMILGVLPAGWWTLLTPGFAALLLCHMAVVGQYLLRSLRRAEETSEELARAIAARELLLRDMHDGLGSQLMTALRGVERGAMAPPQVAASLQDSLEELRMLMDSTDMEGWLPGVLAGWRNRWDARLAAAGVTLRWHIDESLDRARVPGDAALQVMRILQEACANVLKHAQATHLSLDARVVEASGGPVLRIDLSDDGVGLTDPVGRPGGRGLQNMRYRAERLGAQLAIGTGEGGGTRVSLALPLPKDQDTSPRRAASIAASARDEMPSLR